MAIAASPTSSKYGNMIRVSETASDACAGSFMKPGAIAWRMYGAPRMPKTVVTVSARSESPRTARSMRWSSGRSSRAM